MKKRVVGKGVKKIKKIEMKKTLAFKLLILSLIILIVLIVAYIFVYESGKEKEERLRGELGTLKWDFNKEKINLSVLNYTISEDNLTIDVNINRSSGNQTINAIFFDFIGPKNGCNYTQVNDLVFGENKTINIKYENNLILCNETDFSNVTKIVAFAQIHINLTQTGLIPNITFYKEDSRNNLSYLNNYFYALTEINYNIVESPINDKIEIIINNTTKKVSISTWDTTWSGSQQVNLTAVENQETLTTSFYIHFINTTRPISNHAPSFNSSVCDDLIWNKNTSYEINMTKCWKDADGDSLTLRYENRSNANLSISQSGVILTLIPNTNWFGTGYFYLYADDGKVSEDESARIDFIVRNPVVANGTNTTNTTANVSTAPKIKSSNPSSTEVYIFMGNKTFTISAEKYETIKWYLNNVQVVGSGTSLDFNNLKEGDVIKVEVINGTRIDSKTWNIKVAEDNVIEKPLVNAGIVIFYAIIVVICIIIILVIWLFVEERMKKNIPAGFGFAITYGSKH
ncbi:MAG: hypothetical protein AABW67_02940 [Nanoarchaeota archaeon]